ncbi:MAG: ethanolamine ammonia lyase large subunit [Hyphomicrobium sp.]|nr:ethanolamine ammonia lyase large subunit [Hyphomicrobium sp.]PPC82708.1 MAG: ethanolamine ammonia lyase large subunit [Hyphomicrobium sp.]
MAYSHTVCGTRYVFPSLKVLLAKASPPRAGDRLAGIAAASAEENVAAKLTLADVSLKAILAEPLILYEDDDVTRLILDRHDTRAFAAIASMTVGEFRDYLLSHATSSETLATLAPAITPEIAAAVSKLMRNQDLILAARKCRVVTRFRNTLGLPGTMAVRLQPNHPTDDLSGITAAIADGLMYGCGDACIGINPASDQPARVEAMLRMLDDLIRRYEIPTQSCVLCHVTTALDLMARGVPTDLVFQSIGGTEATNRSFGITLDLLREANEAARSLRRGTVGENVMYFETGQGSALSAGAHHGVDQQTCEARAYAVARAFDPLLVNTVVGFIGPEYLYDGKEILRAALEDHFCGKLMGLPMGVDVCYTNHAEADQDDMDVVLTALAAAGVTYIMGVPGADDVMLGYQSTSFHDALYVREAFGLKRAPEFEGWLERMAITDAAGQLLLPSPSHRLIAEVQAAANENEHAP